MKIETIWSDYQTSLRAFLSKHLSDQDDVDDLLQEVLIKTHHNLGKLKDSTRLKSWLFQIAHNALMDHFRRQCPTTELSGQEALPEEEQQILDQMAECVLPFIQALPEEEASLLKAIEIEGISQKEYAEVNGIKYSTLKSRVKKSRQQLHQLFSNCCEFSLDHRGNVMDISARKKGCSRC